ncbi:hypothetical protein CBR_g12729 [Chara braunii]|uniref:Uncharacterized protein n=1 Tax=Chara braunii TaxID=69332 RepID=A0A388KSG9_CHABU|nr:hypothetical protein CBR_g12729 [Chara braunii]|eukprot:GBG73010.1 hypothetical protein CBR_g12729 [Chara braunii]
MPARDVVGDVVRFLVLALAEEHMGAMHGNASYVAHMEPPYVREVTFTGWSKLGSRRTAYDCVAQMVDRSRAMHGHEHSSGTNACNQRHPPNNEDSSCCLLAFVNVFCAIAIPSSFVGVLNDDDDDDVMVTTLMTMKSAMTMKYVMTKMMMMMKYVPSMMMIKYVPSMMTMMTVMTVMTMMMVMMVTMVFMFLTMKCVKMMMMMMMITTVVMLMTVMTIMTMMTSTTTQAFMFRYWMTTCRR